MKLTKLFNEFFDSEKSSGIILVACTIVSLLLVNVFIGEDYLNFWHQKSLPMLAGVNLNLSVEHWINDGLMAIFFLMVGLEIERELYIGELSAFKNALVPIIAAIGGMVVPALFHFALNAGTETQNGFGIPMATDIAFALGIMVLVGKKVPFVLKIFLTALAIIDDLGGYTGHSCFLYKRNTVIISFCCAGDIFNSYYFKQAKSLPAHILFNWRHYHVVLFSAFWCTCNHCRCFGGVCHSI